MTHLDWITLFETVTFGIGLVTVLVGGALLVWGIATKPNVIKASERQTERFLGTLFMIRRLIVTRGKRPA